VVILLVEDNAPEADLALHAIRRAGFAGRIVHVDDGVKALEYLAANAPPQVVFLDLRMPRLDGIGVLRRLKADEGLRTIPVVMLTSSDEPAEMQACYRLGANSYVVKPAEFAEYLATLSSLVAYWTRLNGNPVAATTE
jgi:two-component system, response regulator